MEHSSFRVVCWPSDTPRTAKSSSRIMLLHCIVTRKRSSLEMMSAARGDRDGAKKGSSIYSARTEHVGAKLVINFVAIAPQKR
jgi:hypothetical protein